MKLWAKILVGFISFSGFIIVCALFYSFYNSSGIEEMKFRTQAKIQMREAKAILSGIVQRQTLFRARHGSYVSDLKLLGYKPKLPLVYKFGFAGAYDPPGLRKRFSNEDYDPKRKDSDILFKGQYQESANYPEVSVADMALYFCPRCHIDNDSYVAIAFANLDEDEAWDVWIVDEAWDVWIVDEARNFTHISNDLEL